MAVYPIDVANRVRISGNRLKGNDAAAASAALLVPFYDASIRFTNNVVEGRTHTALVSCDALTFRIPRDNRLHNPIGPELGGTCIAGAR